MTNLQKKIILKALDALEKLSEWEYDFVNNLADKSDDYELSKNNLKFWFSRYGGR